MKASKSQLKYFSANGLIFSPFHPTRLARIKNLADRLTVDAIKNPIRFASVTPAAITQTLFGHRAKSQVKTISKKLVRALAN